MKEYWPYIFNEMIFKIFEIFATFKAIYLILIVMNYSRLKVCFVIFRILCKTYLVDDVMYIKELEASVTP